MMPVAKPLAAVLCALAGAVVADDTLAPAEYRRPADWRPDRYPKTLQQIADAQIDFIIMDQTNMIDVGGGYINRNALKVAQAIQKWNESGKRPIRYCSGIGALACYAHDITIIESEAKILWERYCTQPFGTERDHMFIDGKPLMVIFETTEEQWNAYDGDKTYTNKFTLRFSVGHAYAPGMWGWVCPRYCRWVRR